MQYMLLIYGDEDSWSNLPEADQQRVHEAFFAYGESLENAGILVGGSALGRSETATVVSVQDGETVTTDGPFAETKEQLGGYYIVDVDSLDEALEWAARIPTAAAGQPVEVRPLVTIPRAEGVA